MKNTRQLNRISQSKIIVNSFIWINKYLFKKYCQSQNYYYTRDVNEILVDASSKAVIRYKDWIRYDDDDEYLKRYYYYEDEYPQKIQLLTEYYKFHNDIPRIFMEPIISLLNQYYDKKRRYEYYRIVHLIEIENKRNPNGSPKRIIIRERPQLTQESQKDQQSQTNVQRIKNTQILKDLSWLNKSSTQISYTLQQICKQMGNVNLEQSSLLITSGKEDEMQLDKFLIYINQQTQKIQRDKVQQINKYNKTLSQPHEQLVQTLIQRQNHDEPKHYSQHCKQNTELAQQMNKIQRDININSIKNQVDSLSQNKQCNHIRMYQNDQIKQSINEKSNMQTRQHIQLIPQLQNHQNQNLNLKLTIGTLNLKQISKIFIENDSIQQVQTHRPNSGTKNFFSNRNSPTIQNQNELKNKVLKQTQGQISTYSQIQQQQSLKNIKTGYQSNNRKSIHPNIHFRYRSNQDKIQCNIQQSKHKKCQSECKLLKQPLLNNHHQQFICLTDRVGQSDKNNLVSSYQNSPKTNILKKVGGAFQLRKPN